VFPPYGFWAAITATDNEGKYSWKSQVINSDGTLSNDTDNGTSGNYDDDTLYAVEALWASKAVIIGSMVWLYPALTQEFYVFPYVASNYVWVVPSDLIGGGSITMTVGSQHFPLTNPYSSTISSGTTVTAGYFEGAWKVIGADCPSS